MSDAYQPLELDSLRKKREDSSKVNELEQEQSIEDLRWLMSTAQGRRIIHRLLSRCGVYRSSFTGNSETFFREGERNIGLFILADVQGHCPNDFVTMLKEHTHD